MNRISESAFNVALGKRLSLLRQAHKMSLGNLGMKLGVSHQQIHKYETGESALAPKRIEICATLFNVPIGYFYGEDRDKDQAEENFLQFDKNTMMIAAEVGQLPEDIRKGVYHLSRQINKSFLETKQDKEMQKETRTA